jgi:hypothetical protein
MRIKQKKNQCNLSKTKGLQERSKSKLRKGTGSFAMSVPLSIRIKQLDSHEEKCRELSDLRFEPKSLTNFGFGKNPPKITDNSQEDLRTSTFTSLVNIIKTVFSVRYASKTNKQLKIYLSPFTRQVQEER